MRHPVLRAVLFVAAAALPAFAQSTANAISDPANLTGERVTPPAPADTLAIDHGAPALQQLLLKLRTRASLMLIVAHPDDEDGGLLAYESRGLGARVAMLTLTRGEGGQNLMSADFNEALGLLRTQELLAADRYMGVDQFFGTEIDFGFSKTKEETFAQWTHERVLFDAVRAVRLYRPLVLASVFVGGPTDGHGHHQVAGEITQEVFTAAADPKVFPEMGLPPWAPLKVYARVPFSRVTPEGMFDYATGKTVPTTFHNYVTGVDIHTEPQPTVLIHQGDPATIGFGVDPGQPALGMEGLTYVQFARKGLALQKTQIGPGVRLAPAGRSDTGYTLMGSRLGNLPASEASLFDGVDTSLASMAGLAPSAPPGLQGKLASIDTYLAAAQALFTGDNIELTAPPLRDALRALDALLLQVETFNLPTEEKYNLLHELRGKRVQLNDALVLAHHLSLSAEATEPQVLTTLTSFGTTLAVTNAGANSMRIVSTRLTVNLAGEGIGLGNLGTLEPRTTRQIPLRLPYLAGLPATRPYFSRVDAEQPFYNVDNPNLRNAPATPDPIRVAATLDDQGVELELAAVVLAPPVPAPDPPRALVVVPPVSVSVAPRAAIVSPAERTLPLNAQVGLVVPGHAPCPTGEAAPVNPREQGKVTVSLPEAWTLKPEIGSFAPGCEGTHSFAFTLTPPAERGTDATLRAQAVARLGPHNYGESYRAVGYPGLTYTNLYRPATLKAVAVDVTTAPGVRVAYLSGTGDEVAAFLPGLGVTPVAITLADLVPATLARYDVVLLGVRAYAAHPELAQAGSRPLNDFAAAGGVVLVQYNSAFDAAGTAPFPYRLAGDSAHNVVVETDPVTLLAPEAPLLNWPNKITSSDFDGWIEERGHGFASTWDPRFQALLETHDPDQEPQQGGLLLAPVGKGAYIYVALALYRQLPEAVPGAYRLFANLLSYGSNPGR